MLHNGGHRDNLLCLRRSDLWLNLLLPLLEHLLLVARMEVEFKFTVQVIHILHRIDRVSVLSIRSITVAVMAVVVPIPSSSTVSGIPISSENVGGI